MDDDEAVRLRRAVLRIARRLNTSATAGGLTPTQASVLGLVVVRGPISVAELVRLEQINPTMLSRVIGKLDEAGLVVRTADPADQRAVRLRGTRKGRTVYERIRIERALVVSAGTARLGVRDRDAITRALPALERLADELQPD